MQWSTTIWLGIYPGNLNSLSDKMMKQAKCTQMAAGKL